MRPCTHYGGFAMIGTLWIVLLCLLTAWGVGSELSPSWKMVVTGHLIFGVLKMQALISVWRKAFGPGKVPGRSEEGESAVSCDQHEREERHTGAPGSWHNVRQAAAWLIFVPTLNPDAFFGRRLTAHEKPRAGQWLTAGLKALLGAGLLFVQAPRFVETQPMLAGWLAMVGMILLLHFGLLELLVLACRYAGRNVQTLMNRPIISTSLSEFWGRRWNTAFRDFAHEQVFRPVCRRWNAQAATIAGFAFSGLIHELAISVPAGGGYGLPFGYFLLQGIGVFIERVGVKRGLPFRSGWCGWLFAAVFLIPGAFLLFHPPFVRNVILPMVEGIAAWS